MNLIKLLTVENQENIKIYNLIDKFFLNLKLKLELKELFSGNLN